jgi:hypothetical protein
MRPISGQSQRAPSLGMNDPRNRTANSTMTNPGLVVASPLKVDDRGRITLDLPALSDGLMSQVLESLVFKSPNGTRWRVTVSNAGTVTATPI